jgi:hypothetical protein
MNSRTTGAASGLEKERMMMSSPRRFSEDGGIICFAGGQRGTSFALEREVKRRQGGADGLGEELLL